VDPGAELRSSAADPEAMERRYSVQLTTLLTLGHELSKARTPDELCRQAVELGRHRLGFERLAIWFIQRDAGDARGGMVGSYGTDEQGRTRDERGQRVAMKQAMVDVLAHQHPTTIFEPKVDLFDHHGRLVGHGTRVRATIWDGREIIGFLIADNLLSQRPIREPDRELLRLYASTLGHLCAYQRADEAWRQSEERIRQVVESLPIILTSVDGRNNCHFLMAGPVQEMFGYPVSYFLEAPDFGPSIVHPDDRNFVFHCYREGLASKQPFELEMRMVHGGDGRDVWVHQRIVPVYDENGALLRQDGVTMDITGRKQAEDLASRRQTDLAHVSRLGMVGELAAGLAHELNQPLTAIANDTRSCARRLQGGETGREILEDLECAAAQAERAGNIIRRMGSFIRKGEPQRAAEDIEEVVREIVALSEPEMRRRDLVLKMQFEPALPRVLVDRVEIQQVILNLLRNGWEAMAGTGRRELGILVRRGEAGRIAVRVSDAGHGVSYEQMEHLFEPFYTTKPDGMGLGLALSRSLIEAHGGRIHVESNRPHGLSVEFTLPATVNEV
jgi:PAS domain S-box-containing protein